MNHAHFIGIAGIAMSAVALLLREAGWQVSGSDEAFYPPSSQLLPANGIAISTPHAAVNIPLATTHIIIGKHSTLTAEANPEVAAAFALQAAGKAQILSYPEVLKLLTAGRHNVVVCGSYGKSTTASLITWLLESAGVDAGFMLGARALNFDKNSRMGSAPQFVLEGDEYPSSNTDDRAKFLHYAPSTVVLTSAQHDHPNIFATHADYLMPFAELLGRLTPAQTLVYCADDADAAALASPCAAQHISYGLGTGDYRAAEINYGPTTHFNLTHNGTVIVACTSTQLGAHNVQNMVGAAACVLANGWLTPAQVAAGLATFKGVKRRMECLSAAGQIPAFEGFGSSADKARSAIAAIQLHYPNHRLVALFEPHTFGWRNPVNLPDYDTTFAGVDVLAMLPPPTGDNQLTQTQMADRVAAAQANTRVLRLGDDVTENMATMQALLQPTDVLLLLSSGHFGGMLEALLAALPAHA